MIALPLITFFLCSHVFFATVSAGGHYSDSDSLTYSGLAAVFAANVVTVGYVIYATCCDPDRNADYDEEEKDNKKSNKKND
jgi:hypothetical protein